MAKNTVSPVLFDISADIAGEIPIDLVQEWANSNLTKKTHNELLAPFIIEGTVVSSDSAGLSKLSEEKGLIEVMKLVNDPKEVIFKHGVSIGGRAIGTWFADNTEMIYSNDIDLNELLKYLASAQREISKLPVQVGLCVHKGKFIEIGNGLYGDDADYVESIAEDYTSGGEIVVSNKVKNLARKHKTLFDLRQDLVNEFGQIFKLNYEPLEVKSFPFIDELYPIPFSEEFYNDMKSGNFDETEKKYTQKQIVVLVKVDHPNDTLLLTHLSNLALSNYYSRKISAQFPISEIKSNGQLAIYVTNNVIASIEFALELRKTLKDNDFLCKIGISSGEVLVFDMRSGGKEIAGEPVNIASKLAEDYGKFGYIYIHDSISLPGKYTKKADDVIAKVSHVELKGWKM